MTYYINKFLNYLGTEQLLVSLMFPKDFELKSSGAVFDCLCASETHKMSYIYLCFCVLSNFHK